MKRIKIGDWVEALIYVITFGYGEHIALWKAEMDKYGFEEIQQKLFTKDNTSGCGLRWDITSELTYKLK